jgi:hypothetical protein
MMQLSATTTLPSRSRRRASGRSWARPVDPAVRAELAVIGDRLAPDPVDELVDEPTGHARHRRLRRHRRELPAAG